MNYYPHHIGDYLRDTAHLSPLEDGIYRRMLDLYYASEKPLPSEFDWLCKLLRVSADNEREAAHQILRQFFYKADDGWRNKRADHEIKLAHQRSKSAKKNGKKGGRPRKLQVISGLAKQNPSLTQEKALQNQNQNQNQNQKRGESARQGSRLPPDWQPSEILKAWAVKERPDLDVATTIANFADHWISTPGSRGVKLDWDATFRKWVRGERAGTRVAPPDYSAVIATLKE